MNKNKALKPLRVLGVIPARGGSKAIPKKNIVDLGGKPLIAYTIEAARNAMSLDCFIVSTDSDEVASVAKAYGAEVPFLRPKDLSTDSADSLSVISHALEFMEKQNNSIYDVVVMLQPTTPFRDASLIDSALDRLMREEYLDSIVSVVDVGANHPYRMYSLDDDDRLVPFVKNVHDPMMPRQKLPPIFIRSGDIYAVRRGCLIEQKSLIGRYSGALVINNECALNIDEPVDLEIARMKFRDLIDV